MLDNPQDKVISTRQLGKTVETTAGYLDILRDVDLEINTGETVAIVGVSGSGKSTLLGLLAGLDTPSRGDIFIAGKRLNDMDEDGRALLRHQLVGFVFQSFQLLPNLTALENVMLPLELAGKQDPRRLATALLSDVQLDGRLNHYPKQLSGGEQQRVSIARAFSMRPAILFADEPTGNLDTSTGAHVMDLLFKLNSDRRTTLVLVTHDSQLANRCGRQIRMEAGTLVHEVPDT